MSDENDMHIFDPALKKKKKKKVAFDQSVLFADENDVQEVKAPLEDTTDKQNKKETADNVDIFDESFDPTMKKKKKKKKILGSESPPEDEKPEEAESAECMGDGLVKGPWLGTERDYTYDELLKRVIDLMREKNPDMVAGERKKFVMKPPQVVKVGTKKTSFVNFTEICKILYRQPKHFQSFVLAELGTSGSVDGNNQLIIKGRFQQKQIETVLRRYIKEYVTCKTCKSPETILQRDVRLFFLQCESCGSRYSVAIIKAGFQAVTGKRAAMRAKNE